MWPCLCAAGAAAAVATAVAVVLQEHGVSQEQQEEQAAVAAAAAAANFFANFCKDCLFFLQRFSIFSRVSEATLDTFLVGFSD